MNLSLLQNKLTSFKEAAKEKLSESKSSLSSTTRNVGIFINKNFNKLSEVLKNEQTTSSPTVSVDPQLEITKVTEVAKEFIYPINDLSSSKQINTNPTSLQTNNVQQSITPPSTVEEEKPTESLTSNPIQIEQNSSDPSIFSKALKLSNSIVKIACLYTCKMFTFIKVFFIKPIYTLLSKPFVHFVHSSPPSLQKPPDSSMLQNSTPNNSEFVPSDPLPQHKTKNEITKLDPKEIEVEPPIIPSTSQTTIELKASDEQLKLLLNLIDLLPITIWNSLSNILPLTNSQEDFYKIHPLITLHAAFSNQQLKTNLIKNVITQTKTTYHTEAYTKLTKALTDRKNETEQLWPHFQTAFPSVAGHFDLKNLDIYALMMHLYQNLKS